MWLKEISKVLLLMVLCLSLVGCSKPCDNLADRVCEKAGVQSEECTKASVQAKEARTDEQRACRRVMDMVETLSKNK